MSKGSFLSLAMAVSVAFGTSGCSTVEEFLVGEPGSAAPARAAEAAPAKPVASVNDAYVQTTTGALGANVVEFERVLNVRENMFSNLRADMIRAAAAYQMVISQIRAELQVGTTPGNPALLAKTAEANTALSTLGAEIEKLAAFQNSLSKDATQITFLDQSLANALRLSGGTEKDRQDIYALGLQAGKLGQRLGLLTTDAGNLVARHQELQLQHRAELNNLTLLIQSGTNPPLSQQTAAATMAAPMPTPQVASAPVSAEQTTDAKKRVDAILAEDAIFRLEGGATGDFSQDLYDAVSKAYGNNKDVTFRLVGIAPLGKNAEETRKLADGAKASMQKVFTALGEIGLPENRVILEIIASGTLSAPEVRLLTNG